MKVAGSLDTNVLVRHIVQDDERQAQLVAKALDRHVRRAESLWVPVTVILELEWVLRSRYRFSKAEVMQALFALLVSVELVFESEAALEQALLGYEEGPADFAEYLHLALAHKGHAIPFLTFDQKAAKAQGAKLLR